MGLSDGDLIILVLTKMRIKGGINLATSRGSKKQVYLSLCIELVAVINSIMVCGCLVLYDNISFGFKQSWS